MKKNINKKDRLVRLALGVFFLILAMLTNWNPILLLISGFCIFESVFSWCLWNQIIGKNTCPVE
jgi:hypothetical protein